MVNDMPQDKRNQTAETLQKNLQDFLRQGEGSTSPIGPVIRQDSNTPPSDSF